MYTILKKYTQKRKLIKIRHSAATTTSVGLSVHHNQKKIKLNVLKVSYITDVLKASNSIKCGTWCAHSVKVYVLKKSSLECSKCQTWCAQSVRFDMRNVLLIVNWNVIKYGSCNFCCVGIQFAVRHPISAYVERVIFPKLTVSSEKTSRFSVLLWWIFPLTRAEWSALDTRLHEYIGAFMINK